MASAQRDRLRRMQSAWLSFRTAACRCENGPVDGGSAEGRVYWTCASRMTRERAGPLDEDCLYLNVWTPRAEPGAQPPVPVGSMVAR